MAKGLQDVELYTLFLRLNQEYFDNWLPKTLIVSRSSRLTRRAGACYFYIYPNGTVKPLEICLSDKYLKRFPNEVENVLLHEMIHMKLGHIRHNQDFHNQMEFLNKTFNLGIKVIGYDMHYFYQCNHCGRVYRFEDRINTFLCKCEDCNNFLEMIDSGV